MTHTLIPSVYRMCDLDKKGTLTYSGETFIRVRNGKHVSSTAYTHAHDIRELLMCERLYPKPIMITMSDGASDEAPRLPKLNVAIDLFKLFNVDMHGVNASGLSAIISTPSNGESPPPPPLSHDLAGVILPHDSHGSHLKEILSEIWSNTVIDGKSVDCAAVPLGQEYIPLRPVSKWVADHVQQSRYSLQIVKCNDHNCCEPFVADWLTVFPDRFVPFPAVYGTGPNGVIAVEPSIHFKHTKEHEFASLRHRLLLKKNPNEANNFDIIPFDLYCTSMKDKLHTDVCPHCKSCWSSAAAMLRHKKCHNTRARSTNTQHDESDASSTDDAADSNGNTIDDELSEHEDALFDQALPNVNKPVDDDRMPVFGNIFEILQYKVMVTANLSRSCK